MAAICKRCNGRGGWEGWPGFTCYRCRGNGQEPPKEGRVGGAIKPFVPVIVPNACPSCGRNNDAHARACSADTTPKSCPECGHYWGFVKGHRPGCTVA